MKRELQEETDKVRYQQDGIDKLEEINRTVAVSGGQLEEARLKVNEMKEIREQLLAGEQEKISLLQELLQQRRDFRGSDLSCNQVFPLYFFIVEYVSYSHTSEGICSFR